MHSNPTTAVRDPGHHTSHHSSRRACLALLAAACLLPCSAMAQPDDAQAWAALRQGGIVLLRHANAPGVGDPAGMVRGDCATQRNLDAAGRAQAHRIGERFATAGVAVGAVWTSQWCRTRETAQLLLAGATKPGAAVPLKDEPAFNSFFGDAASAPVQTAAAARLLRGWRGPGTLVVSTHQVNITALTGLALASGEGIVVRFDANQERLVVLGRLQAD